MGLLAADLVVDLLEQRRDDSPILRTVYAPAVVNVVGVEYPVGDSCDISPCCHAYLLYALVQFWCALFEIWSGWKAGHPHNLRFLLRLQNLLSVSCNE